MKHPDNRPVSPFSIPNVRLFIAFKVLFNSRFYYPVFTILFLDFGLTVAQFSILNAVWAASIVLAEVPLGALADIIGRKRLMVMATTVMIIEIAIISFVPVIDPMLIFVVFLINRVLSGFAEAAASGADEAIAYDSLAAKGGEEQWGKVLEVLMRFQSIGFILAMSIGAAIYDPRLMTALFSFFGFDLVFTQEMTMRFPLYLTLVLAVGAFFTTVRMTDTVSPRQEKATGNRVNQAFKLTFEAGMWILKTPFALSVILFGMLFDGVIRMVITLSSQYYRMIELPESVFGLLGSLVAGLGLIVPRIARKIAENKPVAYPVWITAGLTVAGLISMNFFWPFIGLVPALVTYSAMYFTGFFVSYHINRTASSDRRATVLSFKGLAYNISYGVLGVLYALVLKWNRQEARLSGGTQDQLFTDTFFWFPSLFVAGFFFLLVVYRIYLKPKSHS